MISNLKAIGLALVAAFAMSAVNASAASATEFSFRTERIPTTLTGLQHAGKDKFKTHGGTVDCNKVSYHGEIAGFTSTTEVTVEPTYSECHAFGFINVSIDANGCAYVFTAGTKEGTSYEGSVHIECPGTGHERAISITAPGCEVTVPAQTPTGSTVTFTNVGSTTTREITMDVNLSGIHYTEHEKPGFPNCKSGTTTTANGTYEGASLVTGENPIIHSHHGVWVEEGGGGEGEGSKFEFHTETTPTTLTGTQHAGNIKLKTHGGTVECDTATYDGTMTTGTTQTEITFTPGYSDCEAFGFINVPIDPYNCGYVITAVTNRETNYEGSIHIECPDTEPGKHDEHAIRITAPGCEVTIPAQTPTGGSLIFTNVGAGSTRELTVDMVLTGIHYTEHEREGLPTCKSETVTTTNGTSFGSISVTGENPATKAHHGIWVG